MNGLPVLAEQAARVPRVNDRRGSCDRVRQDAIFPMRNCASAGGGAQGTDLTSLQQRRHLIHRNRQPAQFRLMLQNHELRRLARKRNRATRVRQISPDGQITSDFRK